jgi:hypothetical protein
MSIAIVIGGKVTLAGPVFQGAFGVAAGTRCTVLDIPKVAEQGGPVVAVVQVDDTALLMRVPLAETLEGQVNILEATLAQNQKAQQEADKPAADGDGGKKPA